MYTHTRLVLSAGIAAIFLSASADAATTLHPGDKISVNVYNHPELTSTQPLTVDATGRVSVPLAGLVDASNATPSEVAARVASRLSPYVRKPAVDVQLVAQGQNIFVAGGPGGVLPYAPGETLSGALSQLQSGTAGATPSGQPDPAQLAARQLQYGSIDLRHVVIERDGRSLATIDAAALIGQGNPGPALAPDDTIRLSQKPIAVAVGGEVKQPGTAHLDADEPLSNALLQVGGTQDATSSREFVLTREGTKKLVTTSSPEYREPPQNGDAIYVPHAQRVAVVGQVYKPGDVLLQGDNSLLSALYYAGGPTSYGDIRYVSVVHSGVKTQYDVTKLTHGAEGDQNPQLADGDTVFVPEGHKINFSMLFQGIAATAYPLRYIPGANNSNNGH